MPRGCLVKLDGVVQTDCAEGIQKTKRAKTVNVGGVLSHVKRHLRLNRYTKISHLHMGHSPQIVNLGGANLGR